MTNIKGVGAPEFENLFTNLVLRDRHGPKPP